MPVQCLRAVYQTIMCVFVNMRWVLWWVMIIINLHVYSDLPRAINMSHTASDCVKHLDVTQASEVLMYLRQLVTQRDLNRTSSEVPYLCSAAQLTEFCDVYDHVLGQYLALKEARTVEAARPAARTAVHWLNCMFATEPLDGGTHSWPSRLHGAPLLEGQKVT